MRKIESLSELKSIGLNILISFDSFCKKHKINYSIAAGTMLGGVRHKGFIPWDDDIDVFMLREEYEKFIKQAKECDYYIGENYKALVPLVEENYQYPFIKITDTRTYSMDTPYFKRKYDKGVSMDVFPLDNVYDTLEENQKLFKERTHILQNTLRLCGDSHRTKFTTVLKRMYNALSTLIGRDEKYWIKRINERPNLPKGKYIGNYVFPLYFHFFESELLEEYTTLEFEGYQFQSFKHYDEMLKAAYGDYMQLPPEEARKPHGIIAYWRD